MMSYQRRPQQPHCLQLSDLLVCALLLGGAGSGTARGLAARLSMLLRGRSAGADAINCDGITASDIAQAAKVTAGFSGRELAKLMSSLQVR